MTPADHVAINSALIAQLQIIIAAVGGLVILFITWMGAKLHDSVKRLDRQGEKLDRLANGDGDKKIETKVLAMQGEGRVPIGRSGIRSRASDATSIDLSNAVISQKQEETIK